MSASDSSHSPVPGGTFGNLSGKQCCPSEMFLYCSLSFSQLGLLKKRMHEPVFAILPLKFSNLPHIIREDARKIYKARKQERFGIDTIYSLKI